MALVTGWCLSFRRRYVTELIQSSGSRHRGHHSRYHRFFSQASWLLAAREVARRLDRQQTLQGLVEQDNVVIAE